MSNAIKALSSQALRFTVKKAALTLPVPGVLEALNNTLSPYDARNGATVRIAYDRLASDLLWVAWSIVGQGEIWRSQGQPYPGTGHVDIRVPPHVIALSLRKQIEVRYGVVRNGQEALSPALRLSVGDFLPGQLPAPSVPEADQQTGELNLGGFVGDAHVHIAAWPLITEGQRYWIIGHAVLADGTPYQIPISTGQLVTAADVISGVTTPLSRVELEKLQNNSEVKIMASVTFDGSGSSAGAINLPPSIVSIMASGQMPVLEKFNSLTIGTRWRAGETINLEHMSITVDSDSLVYLRSDAGDPSSPGILSFEQDNAKCTCRLNKPARAIAMFDNLFAGINYESTIHTTFYNDTQILKSMKSTRYSIIYYATDSNPITHFTCRSTRSHDLYAILVIY
ncbi:hypothetical protein [Pseudomonas oryziphila]|uniref:Uncharacterized protein n=1 Tax=Pseudomonas oryziphila TaxID=2894079 RepID=A0ABM7CQZ4_9PSED|nr:hypothetical protein [Pseudomonas oryziphila]AZL73852.1 hypothetical protein EI693_12460 [Pseudomonas oryziphila]